jgi:hypothetical protein
LLARGGGGGGGHYSDRLIRDAQLWKQKRDADRMQQANEDQAYSGSVDLRKSLRNKKATSARQRQKERGWRPANSSPATTRFSYDSSRKIDGSWADSSNISGMNGRGGTPTRRSMGHGRTPGSGGTSSSRHGTPSSHGKSPEQRRQDQAAFYDRLYREAESRMELREQQVERRNRDPECTFSPNLSKPSPRARGSSGKKRGGSAAKRRSMGGGMSPHERLYKDGLSKQEERKKLRVRKLAVCFSVCWLCASVLLCG